MEYEKMKAKVFIPYNFYKGQKCSLNIVLCISLLSLSGCSTTVKPAPLAPTPPAVDSLLLSQNDKVSYQPHYFAPPVSPVAISMDNDGFDNEVVMLEDGRILSVRDNKPQSASLKGCHFKDRFDRKAILAYEWNRSRLSLDVDGVNFKAASDKAFRVEYKIKFQPEKTKKQRCRFSSKWQGLFGSSYNEFFVREGDTALDEVRDMRRDVSEYLNSLF